MQAKFPGEKAPWYSSYEQNNYGEIFFGLVRTYQPEKVVELGTQAGYSAYHMARALKENGKGRLDCFDLWEKYEFNNVSIPKSIAQKNLTDVSEFVSLHQEDARRADTHFQNVDFLHIDLNNDGGLLEELIPNWLKKVNKLIIIEGGSRERDNMDWMKFYKKVPINSWLKDFSLKTGNVEYVTFEPFPSLTIIRKK